MHATDIYTLSLHDALPISAPRRRHYRAGRFSVGLPRDPVAVRLLRCEARDPRIQDRKSTRLNSSHANISYAVFCLKKKQEAAPSGDAAPPPKRSPGRSTL